VISRFYKPKALKSFILRSSVSRGNTDSELFHTSQIQNM
jgi:hypothetical protein